MRGYERLLRATWETVAQRHLLRRHAAECVAAGNGTGPDHARWCSGDVRIDPPWHVVAAGDRARLA